MPIIAEYTPEDQESVWALHMATIATNAGFVKNVSFHTDMQNIRKVYEVFFTMKDEEKVVGMVGLKRLPDGALEIKRLQVAAGQQGKGYSKALMEKVFDYAASHKIPCLRLDVSASQFAARKLYETLGFVVTKTGIEAYGPDNEEFDMTYMEKTL